MGLNMPKRFDRFSKRKKYIVKVEASKFYKFRAGPNSIESWLNDSIGEWDWTYHDYPYTILIFFKHKKDLFLFLLTWDAEICVTDQYF